MSRLLLLAVIVSLVGCVFQAGKKQGLVFSKEAISTIKLGMSEEKVEYLIGAPSFKSGDGTIWYYIYTIKADEEIAVDKDFEVERLPEYRTALIFKNGNITAIDTAPMEY